MRNTETYVTKNMMQFCYTCDDAGFCETEEACRTCWTDNGVMIAADDAGTQETLNLLQAYYE